MTWHEMNQRRKANRQKYGKVYQEGRMRRRYGFSALVEKRSGEVIAVARNGCFGRLRDLDADLYLEWASGTSGGTDNL